MAIHSTEVFNPEIVAPGCVVYERGAGGVTAAINVVAGDNQELVDEAKAFARDVLDENVEEGSGRGYTIKDIDRYPKPTDLLTIIGIYSAAHYAKVLMVDAKQATRTPETTELAVETMREIGALPLATLIVIDARVVNRPEIENCREDVQTIVTAASEIPLINESEGHTHIGLVW